MILMGMEAILAIYIYIYNLIFFFSYRYNKSLFDCDALLGCRPDFVVEANQKKPLTKVVGEIKGEASQLEELAVDSYHLGVFGLHIL